MSAEAMERAYKAWCVRDSPPEYQADEAGEVLPPDPDEDWVAGWKAALAADPLRSLLESDEGREIAAKAMMNQDEGFPAAWDEYANNIKRSLYRKKVAAALDAILSAATGGDEG